MRTGPALTELAASLAAGAITSRALIEGCLSRILDSAGQGKTAFITVDANGARLAADAMDRLRKAGAAPSRFAGIPLSIKDLFDIEGQVTRAGSRLLAAAPTAAVTAPAVQRLRQAGFIAIGRTNMTEFAFSGLGINPHCGTPLSPWDRDEMRIAGGSTSGGAASVSDGMAHGALGTDTGGSCRIPAAFCGLVGFKPTASRVPRECVMPLSSTLDSVGSIARTVACCAALDDVLAGERMRPLQTLELSRCRVLVPRTLVLDQAEPLVIASFERALSLLSNAGLHIAAADLPELARIPGMNFKGGFAAAESWAFHSDWIARDATAYDPRVLSRIRRGMEQSASDYIALVAARAQLIADVAARLDAFDFLLMPTTPIVPPRLRDLETDADYSRINALVLRNSALINMIDGCAVSLPMQAPGEPPMGLMIAAQHGQDARLLSCAAAAEAALDQALGRH